MSRNKPGSSKLADGPEACGELTPFALRVDLFLLFAFLRDGEGELERPWMLDCDELVVTCVCRAFGVTTFKEEDLSRDAWLSSRVFW